MARTLPLFFLLFVTCAITAQAQSDRPNIFAQRDILIETDQLKVRNLYPNPVHDMAVVEFQIKESNISAYLVIRNLIGAEIGKYDLQQHDNRLELHLEHLKPGVYFYSIMVEDKNEGTRKFIVSH